MAECKRYYISGRVQGVFFRESTRRQARELDITGHAINLDDGRVEVLACGSADALDKLEDWLRDGPSSADVTDIQSESADDEAPEGFRTG
ncbi:MAG: acylphosphatase [Candidatus Wenzhouxiangella sp. M2_3B_020]